MIAILLLVNGCHSPQPQPTENRTEKFTVRNNAASLLYDVLGDEKDVSKLLLSSTTAKNCTE